MNKFHSKTINCYFQRSVCIGIIYKPISFLEINDRHRKDLYLHFAHLGEYLNGRPNYANIKHLY